MFVNTPSVTLEVYNENKLLTTLEIMKPYSYSAPLLEAESGDLISDIGLWQPSKWDDEYELISFEGYTGHPDVERGRNNGNEFFGREQIEVIRSAPNGRYEMPIKMQNENYTDEIGAGYEGMLEGYVSYLNLGIAQEYGPGICINNTSVPDQYPVPVNYSDMLKYPDEAEGMNPIIIHNPLTMQDVSIGTSALTEQRIGYMNPLGRSNAISRIDINDYFTLYTPTDGALIRNYGTDETNVGSTNKNATGYLNRGLLISEMYRVRKAGGKLIDAAAGALGQGYNGTSPDILDAFPSLGSIRKAGDYMDTRLWTAYKFVQFPFTVIINPDNNAECILANTWISIPVGNTSTKFVVAGKQEDLNAVNIKFTAVACNSPDIKKFQDNVPTDSVIAVTDGSITELISNAYNKASASVNFTRENNNTANHYVNNNFVVDIVGRIGNFTVDYCDDPAVSEKFKSGYIRTRYNMYDEDRGVLILSGTLNSHKLSKAMGNLPLKYINTNTGINCMPKLGYGINYSVQTIGDYGSEGKKLTIIPTYEIDGRTVTGIQYQPDSKTLERIFNVGTKAISYTLSNTLNSTRAKVNPVNQESYEQGDVITWKDRILNGIPLNSGGGILIDGNINKIIEGTPSYMILPTNL